MAQNKPRPVTKLWKGLLGGYEFVEKWVVPGAILTQLRKLPATALDHLVYTKKLPEAQFLGNASLYDKMKKTKTSQGLTCKKELMW